MFANTMSGGKKIKKIQYRGRYGTCW